MKPLQESSTLSSSFRDYFDVLVADTEALRDAVYRIRYAVYCRELAFEDASQFPDGRECDDYDGVAHHCLLRHKSSGQYAGCVRIILKESGPDAPLLPFERFCADSLDKGFFDRLRQSGVRYAELSRLAVPAEFRRRRGEAKSPIAVGETSLKPTEDKRHSPHIALGLYMAATSVGLKLGVDGVFAMMEPRLARHLKRYGIQFQQAGEVMDYHGQRAAYYMSKDELLQGLHPDLEQLLKFVQRVLGDSTHPRVP